MLVHSVVYLSVNRPLYWNSAKRGSPIYVGEGFVPKYTGLYSISVSLFFNTGSTGSVRVGININVTNYDLNGTDTYFVCANTNENVDENMFSGGMVVDGIAGQYIRLTVRQGKLRYLDKYSYFNGYYIGSA